MNQPIANLALETTEGKKAQRIQVKCSAEVRMLSHIAHVTALEYTPHPFANIATPTLNT